MQIVFTSPLDTSLGNRLHDADVLVCCDATDAAFTVALPDAKEAKAARLTFYKTDSSSNAITVSASGQYITAIVSGVATQAETMAVSGQYNLLILASDGSVWRGELVVAVANMIDGSGTANYLPLWTDANTLGDSVVSQIGGMVGVNNPAASYGGHLDVQSSGTVDNVYLSLLGFDNGLSWPTETTAIGILSWLHATSGGLWIAGISKNSDRAGVWIDSNVGSTHNSVGAVTIAAQKYDGSGAPVDFDSSEKVVNIASAGGSCSLLTVFGSGEIQQTAYKSGTQTVINTVNLDFDASGNLYWSADEPNKEWVFSLLDNVTWRSMLILSGSTVGTPVVQIPIVDGLRIGALNGPDAKAGPLQLCTDVSGNGIIRHLVADYDISITVNDGGVTRTALAIDASDNALVTAYQFVRSSATNYRRYYHIPLESANPGASGPTWVPADANTTGGWNLDADAERLRGQADVHADWDGASDLKVSVRWCTDEDNTGGAAGDTVDLTLVVRYKGEGDTAVKSQTITAQATTIGKAARYKQFKTEFTIDWDAALNVVEVGDVVSFNLNFVTATSEVTDIIVTAMEFYYNTTHLGIESGDA